jgi:NitT/TauT family transport system ATP-binding protein
LLRVQGVAKEFPARRGPGVRALDGIDLEVADNELVTLVGRSGCGKSTLLRIVAGLIEPTAGAVAIDGRPVTGPRRDVALMFQRPALLPWRTVLANVLLPAQIQGHDVRAARAEAERLLALVGLDGFEGRRPHELSGGMQQRAALCRALIQRPRLLLMDEPFAALDALTREELSLELQRIWVEHRTTILFVTHSIPEAVLLSDRVVAMTPRPGRVARIVGIDVPRPRRYGDAEQAETIARCEGEVRELLFRRAPEERAA